jgi:cardiolipin synthase
VTWWLLAQHAFAILVELLTFAFAASTLAQRRPSGSAAAWLLVILLLPYVGIPLYLSFGGRKVRRRASRKRPLVSKGEPLSEAFRALGHLGAAPASPAPAQAAIETVEWLEDGIVAYKALLAAIQNAERAIRIQTFLLADDAVGRAILVALTRRARAGVEVNLLLDDLLGYRSPRAGIAELEAAGGRVARFMPLFHVPFRGRANLRNHRKIAVFDGQLAIVGGMNLADEYMGPEPTPRRFRDLSVLLRGSQVAALDAIFRADWEFAGGREPPALGPDSPSNAGIRVVPSGPDCPTDAIYDALLTAIFRAEHRFWVATPYFVPDEGLTRALEVAARRGVDVRIVVPDRSNHRLADFAAAPSLRDVAASGGKVQRFMPGMLHAKAVLVDDALAIVGSANFDMRSLFLDYEVVLFFTGAPEVARLSAWFEATLDATRSGPSPSGRLRTQLERMCRLIAPLI